MVSGAWREMAKISECCCGRLKTQTGFFRKLRKISEKRLSKQVDDVNSEFRNKTAGNERGTKYETVAGINRIKLQKSKNKKAHNCTNSETISEDSL